jgi:membrane protein YdbS with pleckstrin-like domain
MMRLDHLPNSEPSEEVVLFLRRHWIDLLRIFVFSSVLLLVPVVVLTILAFTGSTLLVDPLWGAVGSLVLSSYLFIILIITITEITDYWLDVWIVTNERIINIEQHGLFKRLVSEVKLDQIQDITSETLGFLETFLTYGDVYVQTAANKERFQFKNIDNPDDVKVKISELSKTCQTNHHHEHHSTQ